MVIVEGRTLVGLGGIAPILLVIAEVADFHQLFEQERGRATGLAQSLLPGFNRKGRDTTLLS